MMAKEDCFAGTTGAAYKNALSRKGRPSGTEKALLIDVAWKQSEKKLDSFSSFLYATSWKQVQWRKLPQFGAERKALSCDRWTSGSEHIMAASLLEWPLCHLRHTTVRPHSQTLTMSLPLTRIEMISAA